MEKQHGHSHGHPHSHSHQNIAARIDSLSAASPLGRWNPGFKLGMALALVLLCAWAGSPVFALVTFAAMAALTLGPGRVPGDFYRSLLLAPGVFILLGTVTMAVDLFPQPQGLWGIPLGGSFLCITREGLGKGLTLAATAFGSVSVLYALALSTPAGELAGVLRRLGCPKVVVELTLLIYRFIFVVLDTWGRMDTAVKARLGDRDFAARLRTAGGVMTGLLVLSLKRAGAAYDAMASRCWEGDLLFLEEEKPVRPLGVLLGVSYLGAMGLLLVFLKRMGW